MLVLIVVHKIILNKKFDLYLYVIVSLLCIRLCYPVFRCVSIISSSQGQGQLTFLVSCHFKECLDPFKSLKG